MKKVRDNFFNKVFRPKKLSEFKKLTQLHKAIVGWFPQLEQDLSLANTLDELVNIHKKAWEIGYKNANLAPCPWGMFRTKNISKMKAEEVFLGGIYGLNTWPIPFWESHKSDMFDEKTTTYSVIMQQYRSHLRNNFIDQRNYSKSWLESHEM